jgi:hypothetical protein
VNRPLSAGKSLFPRVRAGSLVNKSFALRRSCRRPLHDLFAKERTFRQDRESRAAAILPRSLEHLAARNHLGARLFLLCVRYRTALSVRYRTKRPNTPVFRLPMMVAI